MRFCLSLLARAAVPIHLVPRWATPATLAQVENPVTISNGMIRLTVNSSVGRSVDFGEVNGPYRLRITDRSVLTEGRANQRGYQGYGGDQLWPAQPAIWGAIRGLRLRNRRPYSGV